MNKHRIDLALLYGGDSSEREVSIGSAAQVLSALDRDKYNVFAVDVDGLDWNCKTDDGEIGQVDKNDFSVIISGRKTTFDYALIMIHGSPGEDGKLQGYFDMLGVPHSTCDMVSSVITFDKLTCKRAVAPVGINLAREVFVRKGEAVDPDDLVERLGLPMFVKPNASGSSRGVTKVTHRDQIMTAFEAAFAESDAVLAEEFLSGREIGCGVMIAGGREYILPVTELRSKRDFFDYEAKYTPGLCDEITPAELDADVLSELNRMTIAAYKACNCRGIVRIDFMVREDGVPFLIEINTVPGMSAGSIVPQQAACAGMTLGQLFDIVIQDTYFERK